MRRLMRDRQTARMFHGAELRRLIVGMLMLVVLGMLIVQSGDPRNWHWLTNESAKPPTDPAAPPPPLPKATGPTDEDPDEKEMAQEEFQALTDGTKNLDVTDMDSYCRLVLWVKNQSFERLYRRAKKGLRYTHLYDDAGKRRGELVALEVQVCLTEDAGKDRDGVPLHTAWATTSESYGRMYSLVIVDYPKGLPLGTLVPGEKATFAGYFLKLQGYDPRDAKPGARPEKAPLLIGRLEWEPSSEPERNSAQEWFWGLALLAILGLVFGVRYVYFKLRRKDTTRPGMAFAPTGEVIPIEVWLERSNFSAAERGTHPEGVDGENQRESNSPEET